MDIKDLLDKSVRIASNKLRIEPPKISIADFDIMYEFDSDTYEIKLSNKFILDNDELTVVGMALHELRHCYQYIQIKFRDKLKELRIPVESEEVINLWIKEYEDKTNQNEWDKDIEVDAFSFMTYFMKRVFLVEADFLDWQKEKMKKKIAYFNVIYG